LHPLPYLAALNPVTNNLWYKMICVKSAERKITEEYGKWIKVLNMRQR
jgi:hypothetical protein